MVTDADGIEIRDADGQVNLINADAKIWVAGVHASRSAGGSVSSRDRKGRVAVQSDLTLAAHPEVHRVGDIVSLSGCRGRTWRSRTAATPQRLRAG